MTDIYFIPTTKETYYVSEYNRSLSTDSKVYGFYAEGVVRRFVFDEEVHVKLKKQKVK